MTAGARAAILTIGHSNHPFRRFHELLAANDVTLVADVRSTPYSQRYPEYNREPLRRALAELEIGYLFLGDELGARPKDRACYANGRVQYRRLAQTPLFQSGLERVLAEAASQQVTLLCAEREPLACHRTILVARELTALGTDVRHILADGRLEAHAEAVERLLDELKLRQLDLFGGSNDRFDRAYAEQESRIAYTPSDGPRGEDDAEES